MNALIVNNSNPAAIAPDQSAGQAQVVSEDLFTVVLEHFPTDTANYASFLPPATTQVGALGPAADARSIISWRSSGPRFRPRGRRFPTAPSALRKCHVGGLAELGVRALQAASTMYASSGNQPGGTVYKLGSV